MIGWYKHKCAGGCPSPNANKKEIIMSDKETIASLAQTCQILANEIKVINQRFDTMNRRITNVMDLVIKEDQLHLSNHE